MLFSPLDVLGIRLPPVDRGPAALKGKTPVVVFIEQGLTAAERLDRALSHSPAATRPPSRYRIEEAYIAVDCSRSMRRPVVPAARETKLEHVARVLAKLPGNSLTTETRLSLIPYASRASVEAMRSFDHYQARLSSLSISPGSDFTAPLRALSAQAQNTRESRKLFLFITDGRDTGNRNETLALARKARETNAASLVVGVGARYDLRHILQITSELGFASWIHTPTPGSPSSRSLGDLFNGLVADVAGADDYLELFAAEPLESGEFWGITPTIRPTPRDAPLSLGYQKRGVGVYFANDPSACELSLRHGHYVGDPAHGWKDIEILSLDDAPWLYRERRIAARAVLQVLLFRAKLERDRTALAELLTTIYDPLLRSDVSRFIREVIQGDPEKQTTRLASYESLSNTSAWFCPGPATPQASATGSGYSRSQGASLHSGSLGPLGAPRRTSSLPQVVGPVDASAYDRVRPCWSARLLCRSANHPSVPAINLHAFPPGHSITVGRGKHSDVRLRETSVSRVHCEIRVSEDGLTFTLVDTKARNPTIVNGEKSTRGEERELEDGDVLIIGGLVFQFRVIPKSPS